MKQKFFSQISDHQQSAAPVPSRDLPHTPSWWSLIFADRDLKNALKNYSLRWMKEKNPEIQDHPHFHGCVSNHFLKEAWLSPDGRPAIKHSTLVSSSMSSK
jgi:hypothetical protein